MFEKHRTLFTAIFTFATFILIIVCGQTTRSLYFVPFIVGCFASALQSAALGGDYEGPAGVAGTPFTYPDPTGSKTGKRLLSIWFFVAVSVVLIANYVENTTIGRLSPSDTKAFFPILILLMIFGIFGFKRK